MPQVSKGCLSIFIGSMSVVMLFCFVMLFLDFRAHGVENLPCTVAGCRTTLWPMVLSGVTGVILLLVFLVTITKRK